MSPSGFTGVIVVALALAGCVTAQVCESPYTEYTDTTDFYGNDIMSVKGLTKEACVNECVTNPACYAIVQKAGGLCFLKNSHYMDAPPQMVSDTALAVDMSCLRGGKIMGVGPTEEGDTLTVMTTVPVADKFVTTKYVWPKGDRASGTATAAYTDAAGVFVEGSEALTATATTIKGPSAPGSTAVAEDTTVLTTVAGDTSITSFVENVDGTYAVFATTDPPQPMTMTPSTMTPMTMTPPTAAPSAPVGGTVMDNGNGTYTLMNTVASGDKYVTVKTVYNATDNSTISSDAFYSDMNGVMVEGSTPLTVTSTSDPTAVDPTPFLVETVTLEDGSTVTTSSVRAADGTITTSSVAAPAPTEEGSGDESGTDTPSPPSGIPVLGTAPPPPGTSGASSIVAAASVFAATLFGLLIM